MTEFNWTPQHKSTLANVAMALQKRTLPDISEQKTWQNIAGLHIPLYESKSTSVTLNTLKKDEVIKMETHDNKDQTVIVLEGALLATIDGNSIYVNSGQSITIKAGHPHELKEAGVARARFFSIYSTV